VDESQVFLSAVKLASPADRAAYLDAACAGNPGLRADVEALLRAHDTDPAFLEHPLAETADLQTGSSAPAESGLVLAGRYELLAEIGEGGMGTVWVARQAEPVTRTVAVKLIKPGMDSKQVLARFEAERQALALMDHPNVARVLDAGTSPDGRPFFVMELVKGIPITQFCDERKLTPRQRMELFVPVCQAIQHAHQKGIIHRDIKPSNVLVALYDDRPIPKVIDFGVAKAVGQPLTEASLHTGLGAVVGTPQYMSPEQANLNNQDIDTRSDVYALGVLLYELLAGSPPFSPKELPGAGLLEMLRAVREEEPPKPSTKLSTADALSALAASRGTEPRRLCGLVRGELDWIVMKALEKDRNRRYEAANGLAQDLERYLNDEPVHAGPPSAWYRFRKFARRNRWPVAAAAAVSLILAGSAAAVGMAWRQTADALANERTARRHESEERARAEAELAAKLVLLARSELEENRLDRVAAYLAECPPPHRGPEWRYLDRMCRAEIARLSAPFNGSPHQLALSPDGRYVAASDKSAVWVWDLAAGGPLSTWPADPSGITWLAFSDDGRHLTRLARLDAPAAPKNTPPPFDFRALKIAPAEYAYATWEVATGRRTDHARRDSPGGGGCAHSAHGPIQALHVGDRIRVLNFRTGESIEFAHGHRRIDRLEMSADGRYLLSTGPNEPIKVWDAATGRPVHVNAPHQLSVEFLVFYAESLSARAERLMRPRPNTGGKVVEVWDVPNDRLTCAVTVREIAVLGAYRFAAGGRILAGPAEGGISVWDTRTGVETFRLRGHPNRPTTIAVSADGTRLVSFVHDDAVRVWDISSPE
jgi:serine/threonine protein kinase